MHFDKAIKNSNDIPSDKLVRFYQSTLLPLHGSDGLCKRVIRHMQRGRRREENGSSNIKNAKLHEFNNVEYKQYANIFDSKISRECCILAIARLYRYTI